MTLTDTTVDMPPDTPSRPGPDSPAAGAPRPLLGQPLTTEEIDALRDLDYGLTPALVSDETGIARDVVQGWIDTGMEKLGACHQAQAVGLGHRKGLLDNPRPGAPRQRPTAGGGRALYFHRPGGTWYEQVLDVLPAGWVWAPTASGADEARLKTAAAHALRHCPDLALADGVATLADLAAAGDLATETPTDR